MADQTSTPTSLATPDTIVIPGPPLLPKRSPVRTVGLLAGGAVAIAAVAVGVSFVGKDDGPAYSLPVAATAASEIRTISYEMDIEMGALGQAHMTGVQDVENQTMSMLADMAGTEAEYLYDAGEGVMYIASGAFTASGLDVGADWVTFDLDDATGINFGAAAEASKANPLDIAPALALADSVEDLGRVDIDGTDVAHYRVTVSTEKAVAAQPQVFGGLEDGALDALPDSIDYDVYVTEGNQLRRLSSEFPMPDGGGSARMTVDVVAINEPVTIEFPDAEDTIALSELMGS